jgi:hypothetical protein
MLVALVASTALVASSAATAKDFGPGDLRLCGARKCVAVTDRAVLRALSSFIYSDGRPAPVRTPHVGAPVFRLRFRDGYVAGMIGAAGLDRFRSHGVICGRFRTGSWYRLPHGVASELRQLTARVTPLRLGTFVPRSC